MQKNRLQSFLKFFILFLAGSLIFYLPVQTLFQAYMGRFLYNQSWIFWLSHWYEPISVILLVFVLIGIFFKKEIIIDKYYILAGALIDFGIISAIFIGPTISRGFEGFRFSLFAVLVFFLVLLIGIDKKNYKKFIKYYLSISVIMAIWAIAERVLPAGYWQHLGLENFGFGQHKVVDTLQSQAIFEGPNQLASFLLPAFFLMIYKIKKFDYKIIFVLVIAAAIFLTFSRSAWIGLAFGLIIYLLFFNKNKVVKYFSLGLIAIVTVGLFYTFNVGSQQTKDIFLHGASQSEHEIALKESMNEISSRFKTDTVKFSFGSGLGTAGPSVLKYGDGHISESWYLQIFIELGLLGLALWLILMYYLLRDLVGENKGLFLGLLSVSIAAFFLHTWADNPAVAIVLFIFLAIAVSDKRKNLIKL